VTKTVYLAGWLAVMAICFLYNAWVIILIVLVFDPLALVLILAADQTFTWHREDKKKRQGWSQVWQPNSEAWPEWDDKPKATEDFDPRPAPVYEPDDGPLTDKQIDTIKQASGVPQDPNGVSAEDFIKSLEQGATKPVEDLLETKNKILERELEAVKATAETLKKKFVNFLKNPLKR